MLDQSFRELVTRLEQQLAEPLPGVDAQRVMAPLPRTGWRPAELPADARKAAGLVLIYPFNDEPHLALTLRAATLPDHAGQVSLPGGKVDAGETIAATAVREAVEEVGVTASTLRLLGPLTPLHIPISNFVLHPIVGVTAARPSFVPSAHEVARVIDVALATLASPAVVGMQYRMHEGLRYEVPYFDIGGDVIWGATAMVLAEFLALVGLRPDRPTADCARSSPSRAVPGFRFA